MSVLEPFLRDPTVAWGRNGRAQGGSTGATAALESHRDTKEALLKIPGRLSGVYNIKHPHADKIRREYQQRGEPFVSNRGLGSSKDEELPLSVPGQAQRLIDEAVMEENLAQMFFGGGTLLTLISLIVSHALFAHRLVPLDVVS